QAGRPTSTSRAVSSRSGRSGRVPASGRSILLLFRAPQSVILPVASINHMIRAEVSMKRLLEALFTLALPISAQDLASTEKSVRHNDAKVAQIEKAWKDAI